MDWAPSLGSLVGGTLILLVVLGIFVTILAAFGEAAVLFPKGVKTRELALVALGGACAPFITKALAVFGVVPPSMVLVVACEAALVVGAAGVAWALTRES